MAAAAVASPVSSTRAEPQRPEVANGAGTEPETEQETEEDARWRPVLGLTCEIAVELPLPGITISDML